MLISSTGLKYTSFSLVQKATKFSVVQFFPSHNFIWKYYVVSFFYFNQQILVINSFFTLLFHCKSHIKSHCFVYLFMIRTHITFCLCGRCLKYQLHKANVYVYEARYVFIYFFLWHIIQIMGLPLNNECELWQKYCMTQKIYFP